APVCPVTPELTLAERFAAADSVVLAKWESAVPAADSNPGSTTFEIVQIPRSSDKNLAKGMRITVDKFHPGKRGRLALVWRSQTADRKMAWQVPLESNSRRYSYILRAPRIGADRE